MEKNKLSEEVERLTKKVESSSELYGLEMQSYYTALLYIAIFASAMFTLTSLSVIFAEHTQKTIAVYIYPILIIMDLLAIHYMRKSHKKLYVIYNEGYEALTSMVECMDWDALRKRFNRKSTPKQNAAINEFVRVTQQRWSPYRQGFKFNIALSLFNLLALALCMLAMIVFILARQ